VRQMPLGVTGLAHIDPPSSSLCNALVWPGMVEVVDVFLGHAMQMAFSDDWQVIDALSRRLSQEPFADRVGSWSAVGRLQPALRPPDQGTSMELALATRVKSSPYLLSRSRIRERGVRP
jgi:hypothetical protein